MAKPADIVQGVQDMYKRCTISAQIGAKYLEVPRTWQGLWSKENCTNLVFFRAVVTLELGNLNLLWEVRYSVGICLDKIFSFGLSCLHVFQSLLWIVMSYELSERKTKKTTSRLANILCCSFTWPSLRLGSLFKADLKKNENEEREGIWGKWGVGALVAGPASLPHSCLLTCNQRWTSGQASPALIISGK